VRSEIKSAETMDERKRIDPHAWTTSKEAVVLFVITKRRSCPLMPQSTCRAAGQSRGMSLMTVSSEQGPTTCHDLVRLFPFFPAELFWILVTLGNGHCRFPFHTTLVQEIVPVIEVSPGNVHGIRNQPEAQRPGPFPSASLPVFRIPTDRRAAHLLLLR